MRAYISAKTTWVGRCPPGPDQKQSGSLRCVCVDIDTARKILGDDKIIGISATSVEEAVTACEHGADYLGIGTIFSTQTFVPPRASPPTTTTTWANMLDSSKKNTKSVIGPEGLRRILDTLADRGHGHVPTVCIGGINASNVISVMFRGSPPGNPLDGVAVVSAIVAAQDPEAASRQLLDLVGKTDQLRRQGNPKPGPATKEGILQLVPQVIKAVHEKKPLSHNMTNLVRNVRGCHPDRDHT